MNKKGIILIFVLMVLATFSLLALGLAFRARIENKLAEHFSAECENFYLVNAKLNQVMLLIAKDDNGYDNFDEDWAKGQNIELSGGGTLKMAIEDEDGKLDVNNATAAWLGNLTLMPAMLRDEIIKNRPFFIIEELFSLEGVDKDMFYTEDGVNILDLVTVEKHDRMNVNTIREEILRSMPGLSGSAQDAVLSLRSSQPVDNLEILQDVPGINLDEYQTMLKILNTSSVFYTVKIQLDDKQNKMKKSFRVILKKSLDAKTTEIIRWLE